MTPLVTSHYVLRRAMHDIKFFAYENHEGKKRSIPHRLSCVDEILWSNKEKGYHMNGGQTP